jgi:RND family efflux transporter MFP subunit
VKKLAVLVLVILAAGGGFWWWKRSGDAKKAAEKTVVTAKVERGDVRQTVASTGKVVSNLDVEIKCKASGEVVKIPFDISQPVKQGDLLLELDPKDERQRVRQAEATLRASQARLVNAKESLGIAEETLASDRQKAEAALGAARARAADARAKADRTRELKEKKLASLEEFETASTAASTAAADLETANARIEELKTQSRALEQARQQIRIAETAVESGQIDLDLARQRLTDTRVIAPMDGVITARSVQIGQIISSGISNVGGGTTALILSDLSRIYALAAVDESDIGQVRVGQAVTVTVDAYPGRRFAGRVERISPRGVNVSNVVTFEVKVEVTAPEKNLLLPEMTANIEILVAEKAGVLLAPSDSIVRKAGKGTVTVQKADGTTEDRAVRTGISDGRRTEILEGLAAGETVVVRNGADSKWQGQSRGGPPGARIPH